MAQNIFLLEPKLFAIPNVQGHLPPYVIDNISRPRDVTHALCFVRGEAIRPGKLRLSTRPLATGKWSGLQFSTHQEQIVLNEVKLERVNW